MTATTEAPPEVAAARGGRTAPTPTRAPGSGLRSVPRPVATVALLAMSASACIAWLRMFVDARGALVCGAAAAGAWGTAVVMRRRSWAPLLAVPAGALGVVLLGTITAAGPGISLPALASIVSTITSLPGMLDTTLLLPVPTASRAEPLLLALTATWIATAAAAHLFIFRSARIGSVACAAALFVTAILLGSPVPTTPVLMAGPLVVTGIWFLAASGTSSDAHLLRRARAAGRLVVVCGAVAIAVALVLASPLGRGEPPSLHRVPDFDPSAFATPLSQVQPQKTSTGDRSLFSISGAAAEDGQLVAIAALDTYNGDSWESRGRFRPIGGVVPPDPRVGLPTSPSDLTVEIAELEGPWIPRIGYATRIGLENVQADGAAANLVLPTGVERDSSFELSISPSVQPEDAAAVAAAASPLEPGPEFLQLPADNAALAGSAPGDSIPSSQAPCRIETIAQVADSWTSAATGSDLTTTRLAKAEALAERFRDEYRLDWTRVPGHKLDDLCQTLGIGPSTQRTAGHDEQYAAAMAVMLRTLGIPSRVMVGYRLAPGDDPATMVVSEQSAAAWVEAHIGGAGWVPFQPTPTEQGQDDDLDRTVTPQQPAPPATTTPQDPDSTTSTTSTLLPTTTTPVGGGAGPVAAGAAASGLVLLGLFCFLAVVLSLKTRRRGRRSRGDARDVVYGAWLEAIDQLRDRGFLPSPRRTTTETASDAAAFVGREPTKAPLRTLATLADRAKYSQQPVPESASTAAWEQLRLIESELDHHERPVQRWMARLRLRSLRRTDW